MQWSCPRCGACWSGSLGGWGSVTFYTQLTALTHTELYRHGRGTRRTRRLVLLCIQSINPGWPHQRGRHGRPGMNGFHRLVALFGPPGSHVHTDGRGSHTATQPTTILPSTPSRLFRLALPNSATTRPMALPADVSACALDTRRRTTILLGCSLAAEFPMSTRYLCRDSRSGSGTTSAPIPNTHTARSDAQKYHNPGARGLPPRSIGGVELSPRLRTCQAVCGGE